MTLLEQARQALPGVRWVGELDGVVAHVRGESLEVKMLAGGWASLYGENRRLCQPDAATAFATLKRWVMEQRDALNAALGHDPERMCLDCAWREKALGDDKTPKGEP